MNTLTYTGKLKKKYTSMQVLDYIKSFVAEKELAFQLLAEESILVDFGIKTDGIAFSFEQQEMGRQCRKKTGHSA